MRMHWIFHTQRCQIPLSAKLNSSLPMKLQQQPHNIVIILKEVAPLASYLLSSLIKFMIDLKPKFQYITHLWGKLILII